MSIYKTYRSLHIRFEGLYKTYRRRGGVIMDYLDKVSPSTESEMSYAIKDAAKLVNVKPSTISKYCAELDKQGYIFNKKPDGTRRLRNEEIRIFKKIADLKSSKTTVEEAIKIIVTAWRNHHNLDDIEAPIEASDSQIIDMLSKIMEGVQTIEKRTSYLEEEVSQMKQKQLESTQQMSLVENTQKEIELQNQQLSETKKMVENLNNTITQQASTVHHTKELIEQYQQYNKENLSNDISSSIKKFISEELAVQRQEVAASAEFIKERESQTEKSIQLGIDRAFKENFDKQETLRKENQPKKSWLQKIFGG